MSAPRGGSQLPSNQVWKLQKIRIWEEITTISMKFFYISHLYEEIRELCHNKKKHSKTEVFRKNLRADILAIFSNISLRFAIFDSFTLKYA
jgi:hypothetical protein